MVFPSFLDRMGRESAAFEESAAGSAGRRGFDERSRGEHLCRSVHVDESVTILVVLPRGAEVLRRRDQGIHELIGRGVGSESPEQCDGTGHVRFTRRTL